MACHRFVRQGAVLTVVVLLMAVLPAAGQDIEWRVDYRKAREEARATGRPLLLDFGTEQCMWCRKLDATTFRDPAVAAMLARDFIPLRIDAPHQSTLTHALKIDRFPTLLFAAPDGTILGRQVGYVDAGRFRGQMERALASVPGRPAPEQGAEQAYQEASAAIKARDYPRAIALLRQIVQGGGAGKIEREARELLQDFENAAAIRLEQARHLPPAEARPALEELARTFNGTVAAREASQTLTVRAH
jgi:hypothetical protein